MLNNQYSPWPCFSQEEADTVSSVLLSNKVNYWTGTEGREFEKEFAEFADTKYAIAVANGTLALDLALQALGLGKGDEVVVTSRTFIASISAIINAGATPVFADVELDSQNISRRTIEPVLTKKTKAIICVHLAGWPCEMEEIMSLANERELLVIEDCAQAHGTLYNGKSVGSFGHMSAWSFCQDKIMTTGGEGGMVTTNDELLWRKAWAYKDHGKSYAAVYEKEHPPGYRWLHESFGTNWRLTEMQSAIGRIQLKKMPHWTTVRNQHANKIHAVCNKYDWLRVPTLPQNIQHAYYKCYAFIRPEKLPRGITRDEVIKRLNEAQVPCFSGSCSEVYKEKAFDETDLRPKEPLKNAIELGDTSLMFLVHPTLTTQEIESICTKMDQVFTLI